MKKAKKPLLVSIILLLMILLPIAFFTDIFGAPLYWRMRYNHLYFGKENNKLLDLDQNNYNGIGLKYAKYCDDLKSIAITKTVPSFDYFKYIKETQVHHLVIYGEVENWSMLKECTTLESFSAGYSNFCDLSLLSNCNELTSLGIGTDELLDYNGIDKLSSVTELILATPELDLSEIVKMKNLEALYFNNHECDITNISSLTNAKKNEDNRF